MLSSQKHYADAATQTSPALLAQDAPSPTSHVNHHFVRLAKSRLPRNRPSALSSPSVSSQPRFVSLPVLLESDAEIAQPDTDPQPATRSVSVPTAFYRHVARSAALRSELASLPPIISLDCSITDTPRTSASTLCESFSPRTPGIPHTPSPPLTPDSIEIIENSINLSDVFLRKNSSQDAKPSDYRRNRLTHPDEDWISWANSPPRPIPALHGPASLPYARCPSGAEGTVIEEQSHVPRLIWGLQKYQKPYVAHVQPVESASPPVFQDVSLEDAPQDLEHQSKNDDDETPSVEIKPSPFSPILPSISLSSVSARSGETTPIEEQNGQLLEAARSPGSADIADERTGTQIPSHGLANQSMTLRERRLLTMLSAQSATQKPVIQENVLGPGERHRTNEKPSFDVNSLLRRQRNQTAPAHLNNSRISTLSERLQALQNSALDDSVNYMLGRSAQLPANFSSFPFTRSATVSSSRLPNRSEILLPTPPSSSSTQWSSVLSPGPMSQFQSPPNATIADVFWQPTLLNSPDIQQNLAGLQAISQNLAKKAHRAQKLNYLASATSTEIPRSYVAHSGFHTVNSNTSNLLPATANPYSLPAPILASNLKLIPGLNIPIHLKDLVPPPTASLPITSYPTIGGRGQGPGGRGRINDPYSFAQLQNQLEEIQVPYSDVTYSSSYAPSNRGLKSNARAQQYRSRRTNTLDSNLSASSAGNFNFQAIPSLASVPMPAAIPAIAPYTYPIENQLTTHIDLPVTPQMPATIVSPAMTPNTLNARPRSIPLTRLFERRLAAVPEDSEDQETAHSTGSVTPTVPLHVHDRKYKPLTGRRVVSAPTRIPNSIAEGRKREPSSGRGKQIKVKLPHSTFNKASVNVDDQVPIQNSGREGTQKRRKFKTRKSLPVSSAQ